jgi:N-acetylglucosamine kinase-like BadF-type ATPase
LCGHQPGIACILGTGSSSSLYNGKRIVQQRPGLGFALGDEGSGAYLGKKLIQYYLYELFDKELEKRFVQKFKLGRAEILDAVYKKPAPSRFLASFTTFLSDNRGHYMIENILEDGFQDFFFHHIRRYKQADKVPIHFTGSIAYVFKDWIRYLCQSHGYTLGQILRKPMPGLIRYHLK